MVRYLISWALNSPLIVILLGIALGVGGVFAFLSINVEAYPDPAPAIIEVIAQYPGASAEDVERRVTIPLEIALAGMPHLQITRTKSLAGLCHMRNQFDYNIDYFAARQEVLNRFQSVQGLPTGVQPQISPFTPTGELMRYTVDSPRDAAGRDMYSLTDQKSLEDWTLEKAFKLLPGIIDVTSFGGETKQYVVAPDPYKLQQYQITLAQFENAIANSNANAGAGYINEGRTVQNVRIIGAIGGGRDPVQDVLGMTDPKAAAGRLREEEAKRVRELGDVVVAATNNVPVRVKDLVRKESYSEPTGVFVGHVPRLGVVSVLRPEEDDKGRLLVDAHGRPVMRDEPDKVEGIVLMRKGESTLPSLSQVKAKLQELNDTPGQLLPGVKVNSTYDQTSLINRTTETVRENLGIGMVLVTLVLLMFLSNVRSALIVAINIPLALLFAFSVLLLRGQSANLLSIGAVDFGIIVDSSVIMVENIYRHLSAGEYMSLSLKDRILRACHEVEKPLFFSTLIMVCAFIPLFVMTGPEGQIFGPMAQTYAFALGGALLLALTVSPALCLVFFRNLRPARDNVVVRYLRASFLRQVERCLNHRILTLTIFGVLGVITALVAWRYLGFEFMPELEEGNLYIRATLPANVSLDEGADIARRAREIMVYGRPLSPEERKDAARRPAAKYPEVKLIQSQVGRPDDGTDPSGFYNVEFSVPLHPENEWPALQRTSGWRAWLGQRMRPRTKPELSDEMQADLARYLPGIDWGFSQYIRDNVMESLSGVKGDNSVKIIGPNIDKLEELADKVAAAMQTVNGVENVGVFHIKGQPNLEFTVDREKCQLWGIQVGDIISAVQAAIGGTAFSSMIEGEKSFDIAVRWPESMRGNEQAVLEIPIDAINNTVTPGNAPSTPQTPVTGGGAGVSAAGTSAALPTPYGHANAAPVANPTAVPRMRLGDLVMRLNDKGEPDPHGTRFLRNGASTIYREQGHRLIAIKFDVNRSKRDLGGAVAECRAKTRDLIPQSYRAEWSGEFEEMEQAFRRLAWIVPLSMVGIFVLLYVAFRNLLDTFVVLLNVLALGMGGVWALVLTGNHFSISAAVGFISIFGVAIMDGLLSISYFNAMRAKGVPLRESILEGAGKRVRPMMMTGLTAILGLLPAALSTKIGSQTQKPLAVVVVGGMLMALLLNRYLMPVLYSFYGDRAPPASAGEMAH
jgi:cobalt-zinc-cadmium resistance protein CzcA